MKLAVVATNSWYLWNFRKETLAAFVAAGHETVCICDNPLYFERLRALGVEVRKVSFGSRRLGGWRVLQSVWALRTTLREEAPEVVLGFTLKANAILGLAIGKRARRWIAVIAGQGALKGSSRNRKRLLHRALRVLMRRAERIVFQNQADQAEWIERNIAQADRVSLISGSGVDVSVWQPFEPKEQPIEVFCHARLLKEKGIGDFLALSRAARKRGLDAEFHLAGPSISELEGGFPMPQIREAEARGEVVFHGSIDNVRPLFHGRTIGCLLSRYGEGVPRSLIETLAMGRPVLMSEISGCEDILSNENGIAVNLASVNWQDEALDFIEQLSKDPERYRDLCSKSRALAEEKFDVGDNIATLMAFIEGH